MFDFQSIDPKPEVREERIVREEQTQTVIGMTHQVMNGLAEIWRLYHHRRNLRFWIDNSDGDLAVMGRLADRMDDSGSGLSRHRKAIGSLYPRLTRGIIDKCADGEPLTGLDIFLINLRPYIDDLLRGEVSIYELDRAYDWSRGRFR